MRLEDLRWARWSGDGNLYYADVIDSSNGTVTVRYYDGSEEELDEDDIFNFPEALNSGLATYGNWQGKGNFYPCKILQVGGHLLIEYPEDGTKEQIPYQWLVFWQT